MSSTNKFVSYLNGKFIEAENAMISIQTHALQYGTTVFGGIRGYYDETTDNVYIFRLNDHATRIVNSAKIMQLNTKYTAIKISEICLELIRRSGLKKNAYIRPFIYTSALQLSPRFHDVETDFAAYILQLDDYLDTKKGLKTMISSWRRISDSSIPTMSKVSGGYVNSALAKSEAVQNGCDEAIFLDSLGFVSEGSAENIFLVRNNIIITPPLGSSILEGITRNTILHIAREMKYEIEVREVSRSELYIADEVFFTGTGVQVAWVKEIDGRIIGKGNQGEITNVLQKKYFEIVKNKSPEYKYWLSPVF